MTEKQQEFQTNLVQFLANNGKPALLDEIVPVYYVTFPRWRPRRTLEHLAALLTRLEQEGLIECEWVLDRNTDVVKSVTLARTVVVEDTRHPSLNHGV